MSNYQTEKDQWVDTNFTYSPKYNDCLQLTTNRNIQKYDKQNVVPCTGMIQSLISTLNQKKYQLKNLQVERQKLKQQTIHQQTNLQNQRIRQNYEADQQQEFLNRNNKVLNEIQTMKRQKLKQIQLILATKLPLEQRYQQILQLKKLKEQTINEFKQIERNKKQVEQENQKLRQHIDQLELMGQNLNNDVYQNRQNVRQNQVKKSIVESALVSINKKIAQTLTDIREQNKQTKNIKQLMTQKSDKIKKRKQQKYQNEMSCSQILFKNDQIQNINIKLKSDLEKCRAHLKCLLKNNQLLQNSIEQFSFVDERVTKLINRNELKKL